MLAMNVAALGIMAIKPRAAWARHDRIRLLRRHLLAALPHGLFKGRAVPLIAPFLKAGFGQRRQQPAPGGLEFDPAGLQIGRRAILALARVRAKVEAATPLPLVDIDRAARAPGDCPDTDVAIVDVPAVRAFAVASAR
jgi:hypothetical protein